MFSNIFKFLSVKKTSVNLPDTINFKIITKDTRIIMVCIQQSEMVISVKKVIYCKLYENDKNFPYRHNDIEEILSIMKLTRVKTKMELKDVHYLKEYNLTTQEEFLLTFRRQCELLSTTDDVHSGPNYDDILAKTKHLPIVKLPPVYKAKDLLLQDDLRKVFITLAKESAYILCTKASSIQILKYYRQKIDNYMKTHENAFKVMYKLGFSQDNVKFAMKLNANNYKLALDWLIDNIRQHENLRLSKSPRSSLISNKHTSILSASFDLISASISDRLDGLLGVVEFYSEMDEPVFELNLDKMNNMGYEIEEAREALRMVKNNIGAACDFLAGHTSGSNMELRVGLEKSSPIYDCLMKMPAVHELLSYTESFVYFNKILEEHIIEWDSETNDGKLMRQIIYAYQDKKHSLIANQFNNSKIPISALSAPLT